MHNRLLYGIVWFNEDAQTRPIIMAEISLCLKLISLVKHNFRFIRIINEVGAKLKMQCNFGVVFL